MSSIAGFALLLACLACLLPGAAAAEASARYGLVAKLLEYDSAAKTVRVKVVETKISDAWNSLGRTPPREVRIGKEFVFTVEPEGSVLRRTVLRSQSGGGLDLSGTTAGFDRAMRSLPADRALGLSIEKIEGSPASGPAYKVLLVTIPMTREEIMRRLDELEGTPGPSDE